MSIIEHGFLSSQLAEVRSEVRTRYRDFTTLLGQLNRQCVAAQYELSLNLSDPSHVLAASYFVRTLATTQASAILLEHGLVAQSKAVLRTALEALFALAALEARPEMAIQLAQTQQADKRSLADKMLRWQAEDLKASRDSRIPEGELQDLKASEAREFKTFQLAETAGMLDWYLSLYALLSHPAHSTVSDLTAHLVTDGDGSIVAIKNEPQFEGQESAWAFIIEVQLRAAKAVVNMFAVESIDVEIHESTFRQLVARHDG